MGAGDIYKPNTFLPQECFYSLKTLNTQYVNNVVVQVEGLYSVGENATLYHTNSLNNYKSYTAKEAINLVAPYNTIDPNNYSLFFSDACTDYTKKFFRKKSVPFPYRIESDACVYDPNARINSQARKESTFNPVFVESRCTNPDFNKNIFIDASTSATNRDKVNEVANRPLVIGFTITEYDARKQYFIKVETEGGVLIDKVKIAKPISENDNQQKVKYYETNGNALEGTVLTKIYNNLEGSLVITLYYNYTDSRGITTTATIGAPVNVNSKVSQNYPTYSVPTLNPVDSKTSSERLYNIRYNINSWIDFSKTEIKEKVASVFNDGGLASNILEAHVRPSFTPLKITDKDKLDWLIDSEGNILIEWQALEELNRNQPMGLTL